MKRLLSILLALGIAAPAFAGTATGSVNVTGEIVPGCVFGATSYTADLTNKPTFSPATASTPISLTCDSGVSWTMTSDADTKQVANSAAEDITFAVFGDAAMTQPLATGGGVTGSGTGSAQTATVYTKATGSGPGGSLETVGTANTSFTITVTF